MNAETTLIGLEAFHKHYAPRNMISWFKSKIPDLNSTLFSKPFFHFFICLLLSLGTDVRSNQ